MWDNLEGTQNQVDFECLVIGGAKNDSSTFCMFGKYLSLANG